MIPKPDGRERLLQDRVDGREDRAVRRRRAVQYL